MNKLSQENPISEDGGDESELTGRYIVLFRRDAVAEGVQALTDKASLRSVSTVDDTEGRIGTAALDDGTSVVFDKLGVAVVEAEPEQIARLQVADDGPIRSIRPERVLYAIEELGRGHSSSDAPPIVDTPTSWLSGYRAGVNDVIDRLLRSPECSAPLSVIPPIEDELTWGLRMTNVFQSRYSGSGVRVAVLDTGMDLSHPDFLGRTIVSQSFVPDAVIAEDGHGHGTHCIGTACGPQKPAILPRYGIAYNAEIYVGKVLSDRGSGAEGWILAGIDWAIANGCRVISMSLGRPVAVDEAPDPDYESIGRRALDQGCLIIAAAGNDSQRPASTSPVGAPANAVAIMAVGALDSDLQVAPFSNGERNPCGGSVDIAGPGVQVYSASPMPRRYHTMSGTSMATPHVAGIAALLAEANPQASAHKLWTILTQTARRLDIPCSDVGSGLVQAP